MENLVRLNFQQPVPGELISDFREAVLGIPGVESAGSASSYNGVAGRQSSVYAVTGESTEKIMVRYGYVDPFFFPVMETGILKGRNFDQGMRTDLFRSVIINEAAARTLGGKTP